MIYFGAECAGNNNPDVLCDIDFINEANAQYDCSPCFNGYASTQGWEQPKKQYHDSFNDDWDEPGDVNQYAPSFYDNSEANCSNATTECCFDYPDYYFDQVELPISSLAGYIKQNGQSALNDFDDIVDGLAPPITKRMKK